MDYSMPGFPVVHYLPEFAQTRVHWLGDAIQPSHPPSSLFPPCPQSFPASGSFPMSWLFPSNGQSTRALTSASVLPMNIQDWFTLWLTGLISLQSKGLSRESSPTPQFKSIDFSVLFMVQLSHPYMNTGKTIALTIQTFVSKVRSLLLNMLSRSVIPFLPRSKCLLI